MMRPSKMLFLTGTFAVLGLFVGEARATFLVQVSASLDGPDANSSAFTFGQSSVTLSVFKSNPADIDLGGTTVPVHETFGVTTTLSTNTTGSDAVNLLYGWTLTLAHIVDGVAVGPTSTIHLTGQLLGNLSASGSSLYNNYLSGPITEPTIVKVDGVSVAIRLDDWTPPGTPPNTQRNFSVSMVDPVDPPINPVPEPTTFALMGIGGLLLLAPSLRRRRR
jgi:hypothetical protein